MEYFNLLPLKNSIGRLKEGIQIQGENPNNTLIRDGLIQRFEFTYELSHKTLKRFLEISSPNANEYEQMSFQNLIRSGNEKGLLLGNWLDWKEYRDMRSRTSHTYDEDMSLQIIERIPKFLKEAEFLLLSLEEKLNACS